MPSYPLLFAGVGFLYILLGIPLARRNVPPNRWYGLRLPATFADAHVWYEANALLGRDFIRLGVSLVVLTLVLPAVVSLRAESYAGILAAFLGLGTLVLTARSWRLANRLLRERRRAAPVQ